VGGRRLEIRFDFFTAFVWCVPFLLSRIDFLTNLRCGTAAASTYSMLASDDDYGTERCSLRDRHCGTEGVLCNELIQSKLGRTLSTWPFLHTTAICPYFVLKQKQLRFTYTAQTPSAKRRATKRQPWI
jgi:hypothetical protein